MYLTQLAEVARRTGASVAEVSGWRTRGHGGQTDVQTIVCHHTAGPLRGNYPSLAVVRDGRVGLSGPLAHYGIGRDGTIYVIAAGRCYHAGIVRDASFANEHAIGIEAENTGEGEPWPDALMASYRALCAELTKEFDLPVARVLGHKEVCSPVGRKNDPTFSMAEFRKSVTAHLQGEDDMPLNAADLAKIQAIVDASVAKVATAVWQRQLTADDRTASAVTWLAYGNKAAHGAEDAANAVHAALPGVAASAAQAAAEATKQAIKDGTVSVDIKVNGVPS